MPDFDLSQALGLKVANQDILQVRIADRTVWPFSQVPLPGVLLGRWPMQDSLSDTSGNERHGVAQLADTVGGWTPVYAPGPIAGTRALHITPGGDSTRNVNYGRTGLEPTTGGFTYMAWFKGVYAVGGRDNAIFYRARGYDSTRAGIALHGLSPGKLFVVHRWRDQLVFDEAITDISVWHHIAIVDDDTQWRVYLDGSEVYGGSRTLDASSPWNGWEDYPWRTGWVEETLANANGELYVSNLRMFHGGLTQAEVQTAMNIFD